LQTAINWLIGWIPSQSFISGVTRLVLDIASVPLVIAIYLMIYYILPNGKVPVARVAPAAIAAAILTVAGKEIYFQTLPLFRFREVYGPFETSVTLLFWAYLGALILLFGAHLSAHMFAGIGVAPVDFGETAGPALAPTENEEE
jgi:membrane protein/epoxyqueuosine reductase